MRRHRFEVSIVTADDDQTDPEEFLTDYLHKILRRRFEQECEEFGCEPWPIALQVEYKDTTRWAPMKEEASGKSSKDRRS